MICRPSGHHQLSRVSLDALNKRYVSMLDDPDFRAIMQDPRVLTRFGDLFPAQFQAFLAIQSTDPAPVP